VFDIDYHSDAEIGEGRIIVDGEDEVDG